MHFPFPPHPKCVRVLWSRFHQVIMRMVMQLWEHWQISGLKGHTHLRTSSLWSLFRSWVTASLQQDMTISSKTKQSLAITIWRCISIRVIMAVSEQEVRLNCALLSRSTAWLNILVTAKDSIVIKCDERSPKTSSSTAVFLIYLYMNCRNCSKRHFSLLIKRHNKPDGAVTSWGSWGRVLSQFVE